MTWPYQAIEEWWGEPFDVRLAHRITQAPWNQLEEFAADVSLSNQERHLPVLKPGNIRPLVAVSPIDTIWRSCTNPSDLSATVRRLLLYAHEVAIEDPISELEEIIAVGTLYRKPNRDAINRVLQWLIELKQLADLGLVVRTQTAFRSKKRHPSYTWKLNSDDTETVEAQLISTNIRFRSLDEGGRIDLLDDVAQDVGGTLHVLSEDLSIGQTQFLACSDVEEAVHRVAINRSGSTLIDGRRNEMRKLLALKLPDLHPKLSDLVALRKSSDEFMSGALRYPRP